VKIAVASGKGGTGKTTVAVNLALMRGNVQLLDCDVEDPDAALFLHPQISTVSSVYVAVPRVLTHRCTFCAECADFCAYNALVVLPDQWLSTPELCKDCGGCYLVCPEDALTPERRKIGLIQFGVSGSVNVVTGDLQAGEAMPSPLIRRVKEEMNKEGWVIVDAPPGTSCAMITAIEGCDACVLVTEPTPFGLHDLRQATEVVEILGMPCAVVINRSDLGDSGVRDFCRDKGLPILLEIPFNRGLAEAYSRGVPAIFASEHWRSVFQKLLEAIESQFRGKKQ
jgi:MinD superfamily P-loop ATPase